MKNPKNLMLNCMALAAAMMALSACVVAPEPVAPPPPGAVVAPAPYPYAGCCYAYPEYPPYPYYYGPAIGVGIYGGGWHGGWRR